MTYQYHRLSGNVEMIVKSRGNARQACDAAIAAINDLEGVRGIAVLSVRMRVTPQDPTRRLT